MASYQRTFLPIQTTYNQHRILYYISYHDGNIKPLYDVNTEVNKGFDPGY